MTIEVPDDLRYLSELYAEDCPQAVLLPEYPSSNSEDTRFQNKGRFIIHDPFPPPRRELLKSLGPHHLMCCWGNRLKVTSDVEPSPLLLQHWADVFGESAVPKWGAYNPDDRFITLFPHDSIPAQSQLIDPVVNYELHSKEIIEQIECDQAAVFEDVRYPSMVKLTHGYAGLGNYLILSAADETAMRDELMHNWPSANLVINSVIENIVTDHGVQFYLRRDGSIVWVGLTEQRFNEANRWCGGTYSHQLQTKLIDAYRSIVVETARLLHRRGYFGLVGVDIVTDAEDRCFLVDVNPRLTGITPFLLASRIFAAEQGFTEGVYIASFRFAGSLRTLIEICESSGNCQALVLSAVEEFGGDSHSTICHLSVSSHSQDANQRMIQQLESHGS